MVKQKKRGAVKKKITKTKTRTKVVVQRAPHLPGATLPILREARICLVDDPKRWGQPGTVAERFKGDMKAMHIYGEEAALLCSGDRCYFCDASQPVTPAEDIYRHNPETPLCECFAPFRKMGFDYIENWDTEAGKKYILTQVEEGKVAYDTPVYQYVCQCGQQVVVDIRTVALGLKKHQKHSRRRRCNKCYQRLAHKRTPQARPPHKLSASTPKNGPGARINKIKHAKNKGQAVPPLPPLEAVLTEQQLTELDKKALEKLKNAQE